MLPQEGDIHSKYEVNLQLAFLLLLLLFILVSERVCGGKRYRRPKELERRAVADHPGGELEMRNGIFTYF